MLGPRSQLSAVLSFDRGKSRLRPGAGASSLHFAIARLGGGDERTDEGCRCGGHFVHGTVEGRLICLRRCVEATELAYELQGGGANLLLRGRGREIEKCSDIPAHIGSPRAALGRPRWEGLRPRRPLTTCRPDPTKTSTSIPEGSRPMLRTRQAKFQALLVPVAVVAILAGSQAADAKGCIKGAVVGGVAGHVAGHHAVAGAAAGCVIGHHLAKKKQQQQQQQRQQLQQQPKPQQTPPGPQQPPTSDSQQVI